MSAITPRTNSQEVRPSRLRNREAKAFSQALARLDNQTDLEIREVEAAAEIGMAKVQAVAVIGNAALSAQAALSARERMLIEAEPGAIHGIAFLSQRLTLALGDVIDNGTRDITR